VVSLRDVGLKVVCPKCGRKGIVRIVKQKKKEKEYMYLVVRHYSENRYCIIKRINTEKIEATEDLLRLVDELEELRKMVQNLKEENEKLKEENRKLRVENSVLRDRLEFFESIWRRSVIISRDERIEEKIEEISNLLKRYDGVIILPFRFKIEIEYGLENK